MIQEYLFVDSDFKSIIKEYSHNNVEVEIYSIDNSNCWIATFTSNGENEKSAKILSAVHEYIIENFKPTILSNGCSAYYNKALYPYYNEFERKLRKLLYLKSALCKNGEDENKIKDLEEKDFGEIFTLLFSDSKFVQNVRTAVNSKTWQFTKSEILVALQQITENAIWDNLIGQDSVPLLRSDFIKVKDYRNDIMHAHNMCASTYYEALKLIKGINEQLDYEIGRIFGESEKVVNSAHNQDFNAILGDAIKDMDAPKHANRLQEPLADIQTWISSLNIDGTMAAMDEYRKLVSSPDFKAIYNYLSSSEYAAIQESAKELALIRHNLPTALIELENTIASMKQHQITPPPVILEFQQSLKGYMSKYPSFEQTNNHQKNIRNKE